jgi:hypothetical protein
MSEGGKKKRPKVATKRCQLARAHRRNASSLTGGLVSTKAGNSRDPWVGRWTSLGFHRAPHRSPAGPRRVNGSWALRVGQGQGGVAARRADGLSTRARVSSVEVTDEAPPFVEYLQ